MDLRRGGGREGEAGGWEGRSERGQFRLEVDRRRGGRGRGQRGGKGDWKGKAGKEGRDCKAERRQDGDTGGVIHNLRLALA